MLSLAVPSNLMVAPIILAYSKSTAEMTRVKDSGCGDNGIGRVRFVVIAIEYMEELTSKTQFKMILLNRSLI